MVEPSAAFKLVPALAPTVALASMPVSLLFCAESNEFKSLRPTLPLLNACVSITVLPFLILKVVLPVKSTDKSLFLTSSSPKLAPPLSFKFVPATAPSVAPSSGKVVANNFPVPTTLLDTILSFESTTLLNAEFAPVILPFPSILIVEFLRVLGTVSVELVSPAFVSVMVVPSKVMPKSLFKNLFVFVSPVPPLPVGTALFTSPFAANPAKPLAAPVLVFPESTILFIFGATAVVPS